MWKILLKDINNLGPGKTLDHILSQYEKDMIVNRIIGLFLIKQGKSYRKISEELRLSKSTIWSLKRILNNPEENYVSYRNFKSKNEAAKIKNKKFSETSSFVRWVDNFVDSFPQKSGPRWKFLRM